MALLTDEVTGLRAELDKKLLNNDPSDLVAFGVLKAGLALIVLMFVLTTLLARM